MGIANTPKSFLFHQLHIKMQLRLTAESHHWWLWNELLILVHFNTLIRPAEAHAEILKKTRNGVAEKINCSCYPKVTSLNKGTSRVGDWVHTTSTVFLSVDTRRTPSSCYIFPQTYYSPNPKKSRAEVPECLTDAPRPQQPIFCQSYGMVQKLCFFFQKSIHPLPRY